MRTPVPGVMPVKADGNHIALKWDEATKKIFLSALRQGYPIEQAAGIAGVSKQTVWRHRRSDPDLNEQIEEARSMYALSTIQKMDKIANGAGGAMALDYYRWRLEKALPESFGKQVAYNPIGQQQNVFIGAPLPSVEEIAAKLMEQANAALARQIEREESYERASATIIDVTPEPSPDC